MLRKILLAIALLAPVVTFAAPNEHAFANASPTGQEHGKAFGHAPEIDGGGLILGLTLLGGIVSLIVRNRKK